VPDPWSLYRRHTAFVLGFHGTERVIVDRVVNRKDTHLNKSEGRYEWLGHGIYFWENDPQRGLEWATDGHPTKKIAKPDVVGAIIDLGLCLDLTTRPALEEVKAAHELLIEAYAKNGQPLPQNRGGADKAMRELDCQVIEMLHAYREVQGLPAYDSVRAPFLEKQSLYAGAEFRAGNHIQICIVKPESSIKGYFRPIMAARL